ncbi:peroxide stress protein YaaA [Sphingomonas sp. PAMC26645]|uniref:peroxide stress protein YaaA n=1 Tax=Sphingomonas sp. PAMC26645 TaxID=2565555 RepID=UPI00109DA19E|nr:peroxide stress protein YaaA [Sphingomonas sp. PAMC26645]QCB42370.1 peroxide stress protein YaaA [Sphingomonas sp. PAMC26645]
MIAVLSPAKTLNYESALPKLDPTTPRFADEAKTLAHAAAHLTQKKLSELMHISPALAKLNADRYRDFDTLPERPAMFAFAGDVYTGLEAKTLDEAAVDYAQDHVRMLSGLYGLLRPLDLMRPYRLEMGTRWAPRKTKLTDWWGDRIAKLLADDVEAEGSGTILNLASQEYWAAAEGKLPSSIRVVAIDFREGEAQKFVSFHAKKARGMVARWLVEHRFDDIEGIKGFDSDGYAYDAAGSSDAQFRFVRK